MRVLNRLGSLVLAVVLLAGGLLLAIEAVAVVLRLPALLIDRAGWYRTLAGTPVNHPVVQAIAIALTLLGLLVLAAQLRRWTPDRLAVRLGDGWHLSRRSVQRQLANTAEGVPGVNSARVRIHGRAHTWHPSVQAVGDPGARPLVERAVQRELERLAAPRPEEVSVRLVQRRRVR
ncbi:DUF6286 domain-containing protein [Micromonospora sp. NPDC049559]|uniref:DUF6286 domain-containing protein n=1 Tax=Micromonospora sp. NPDC049559 TaxID=3155923 RepID=UPI003427AFB3